MNPKEIMRAILTMALLICIAPNTFAANTVAGLVHNESHGQPAVGDEVILVRLDQGMQEEARTRTDAHGAFSLNAQYPDKPYLVRVIHQNVPYDRRVLLGSALSIQVFDASLTVPAVTGTIEILRAGTSGKLLHVSDMYEIVNRSSPPVTKASERTFEVYLPANAKIDSVLAAGPENFGVMIFATPVSGEPGHYSVNFPLRPGATKFAFNYDLPYHGRAVFQTKHAYPQQQLAIMIPRAMKFSSSSSSFQALAIGGSNYQAQAVNQITAGDGPEFEVSGMGALPPLRGQTQTQVPSQMPVLTNSTSSDRGGTVLDSLTQIGSPLRATPSSVHSLIWTGAVCVFLAACSVIVWRMRMTGVAVPGTAARMTSPTQRPITLLEGLKDALFQLETDRVRGSISGEQYAAARQSLDEIIKRAVV
jgi:hypothetical protein